MKRGRAERESRDMKVSLLKRPEFEIDRLQTACIVAAEKEKQLLAALEYREITIKSLKTAENQYKSTLHDAVDKVRELQMLLSSKETKWEEENKSLKNKKHQYKSKWRKAEAQLCQTKKLLDRKEAEWDEKKSSLKSTKSQYKSELQETAKQLRQLKSAFANTEREWNQERKALTTAGVEAKERLQKTENRLEKSNIENSKNQQQIQMQKKQITQLSKKLERLHDAKQLQEDLTISNFQVSELRKELAEKENVVRRLQHDLICMREKAAEGERLETRNKSMEALASQVKSQQAMERAAMQQELDALRD